jgi:hypothetical protein
MPKGVPASGRRKTKRFLARLAAGTAYQPANADSPIVAPVESRFSINERFEFVTDMIQMLVKGEQASVVISGPGGLGKTFTVIKALEDAGMIDITLAKDFELGTRIPTAKGFRVVKGFSTPKGLYRSLYENKEGVIVYDDCDSVLKDPVSLSLLKGALDSYSKRVISWRAERMDEELPTSFEFEGRVVFISNLPSYALDQAIITRSMAVDLSMTSQQKVDRMRFLLTDTKFMEDYPKHYKDESIALIERLQDRVKELSLRTLIQVIKIRKAAPAYKWEKLAEYTICG